MAFDHPFLVVNESKFKYNQEARRTNCGYGLLCGGKGV